MSARADIAWVEIVASLRVTNPISHHLSVENPVLWCLYAGAQNSESTPPGWELSTLRRSFNPRREIGYFRLAIQASKIKFSIEML